MDRQSDNIRMIEFVARRLGDLREKVAFLGGAATSLLLTDPAAPVVRSTKDVDVIVEIVTKAEYYRLEEKLRSLGFVQSLEDDAPICRWRVGEVIVDVMPTEETILGFSNRWYSQAIQHAVEIGLSDDITIWLVAAPFFLGTKIEAFIDRGEGDYRASADLEDIITIVDGRIEIIEEVKASTKNLRVYLAEQFRKLLNSRFFLEALPGHLPPDEASQQRLDKVMERMQAIAVLVD